MVFRVVWDGLEAGKLRKPDTQLSKGWICAGGKMGGVQLLGALKLKASRVNGDLTKRVVLGSTSGIHKHHHLICNRCRD